MATLGSESRVTIVALLIFFACGDNLHGPTDGPSDSGTYDADSRVAGNECENSDIDGTCPDRIIISSDPTIDGASLVIPNGAADPEQQFSIFRSGDINTGGLIRDKIAAGPSITFEANGSADYSFPDVTKCVRLSVPYSIEFTNSAPPSTIADIQLFQLTQAGALLVANAVNDRPLHRLSFCAEHLSTYVALIPATCSPIEIIARISEEHTTGSQSQLETAVDIPLPSKLRIQGNISYVDLNVTSPEGSLESCHYQTNVESNYAVFAGCVGGHVPGDLLLAQRVELGFEGAEGAAVLFRVTKPVQTCATRGIACGKVADGCGGYLDCGNDGNECTEDSCDVDGNPLHTPSIEGKSCGDGDVCNGTETCDANSRCTNGTPLVVESDDMPCTYDYCDAGLGLAHVPSDWTTCEQTLDKATHLCTEGEVSFNIGDLDNCGSQFIAGIGELEDTDNMQILAEQFYSCIKGAVHCLSPLVDFRWPSPTSRTGLQYVPGLILGGDDICNKPDFLKCRNAVRAASLTTFVSRCLLNLRVNPTLKGVADWGTCTVSVATAELGGVAFGCYQAFKKPSGTECCGITAQRPPGPGELCCGSSVVDITANPDNCGDCGKSCQFFQGCNDQGNVTKRQCEGGDCNVTFIICDNGCFGDNPTASCL